MSNEIFTVDDNNNAAVRTVSVKAGAVESNQPDIFTHDENGNAAVRVVGGGDQSNLGYFATPEALSEAYPAAEPGNWAIVGSTDTVWIWDADSGTSGAWVDSDRKGQVTSVNNQTGAVTLGINDVAPTQTGKSGYVLGTDGFVAGWVKPEIVQRSALPQASEEEVGKIYQYIGTTDANYTNGYFYKCVSDGLNPATYSWENIEVQEALPSQSGQSGKFLTTNGTDASWATLNALQNTATGTDTLTVGGTASNSLQAVNVGIDSRASSAYVTAVGYGTRSGPLGTAIGKEAKATGSTIAGGSVAIGASAKSEQDKAVAVGVSSSANGVGSICIGYIASTNSKGTVVFNASGRNETITDANTFYILNENGTYKIMSADGTIPAARHASLPAADGTYVLKLTISGGVPTLSWVAE